MEIAMLMAVLELTKMRIPVIGFGE